MTLRAKEFIRRFLMQVLPPGFTKIRHYGFLTSQEKQKAEHLLTKLNKIEYLKHK